MESSWGAYYQPKKGVTKKVFNFVQFQQIRATNNRFNLWKFLPHFHQVTGRAKMEGNSHVGHDGLAVSDAEADESTFTIACFLL
jgi:hypothetical protein